MAYQNMKFVREAFLIRSGNGVIASGKGEYAKVDFPFEEHWEVLKTFPPEELCFVHVHPPSFPEFSRMDQTCYKALKRALGGDFAFGLVCFQEEGFVMRFIGSHSAVLPAEDLELLKALSQEEKP